MTNFKEYSGEKAKEILFSQSTERMNIGKGMLIGTKDAGKGKPNIMTATWGGVGIMWRRAVCFCAIRHSRYTYKNIEGSVGVGLSLSFLAPTQENARVLAFCGGHSGADTDKFSECRIGCAYSESGIPYVADADSVILCRPIYSQDIKKEGFEHFRDNCECTNSQKSEADLFSQFYSDGDIHRMYICEIEKILQR